MTWPIELVHINQIKPGDTVRHNGKEMTVSRSNLTRSDHHDGQNLFGDSYQCGHKKVERVIIQ
jgi:hypothetical protein